MQKNLATLLVFFFCDMDRKRKATFLFQNLMQGAKKRTKTEEERFEELLTGSQNVGDDNNMDEDEAIVLGSAMQATLVTLTGKARKAKGPNQDRSAAKEVWSKGYVSWDDAAFEARVRVNPTTFAFILNEISHLITKTPTNFQPHPIEPHRQLGLTLYRLAHDSPYQVIEDV